MSIRDDEGVLGAAAVTGASTAFQAELNDVVALASGALRASVERRAAMGVQQAQGYFAEQWHAQTFNINAYKQGVSNLSAEAIDSFEPGSLDIVIRDGLKRVAGVQSKYNGHAQRTATELSKPVYDNVDIKLAPSDQVDAIKKISAGRAITSDSEGIRHSAGHTEAVASDRLRVGGVESRPLSRAESSNATERTRAGEDVLAPMRGLSPQEIASKAAIGGAVAAGIGFAVEFAPTVLAAIQAWRQGQRLSDPEFEALLRDGLLNSGRNALLSGLQGAISTALVHAAAAGHLGQVLADIGPGPIGAMSVVILQAVRDGVAFYQGEIDAREFAWRTITTATVSAGSCIGAAIGQAIIPIPFVGALIGSAVGGIVAKGGIAFVEWISDNPRAKLHFAVDRVGEVLFAWDLISEARAQSTAFDAALVEADVAFAQLRQCEVRAFAALALPPIDLDKLALDAQLKQDRLDQFDAEWAAFKREREAERMADKGSVH